MQDLFNDTNEDHEVVKAVEKLVLAVEGTGNDHETLENTVCGVIQKNPCLEYTDGGSPVIPANDAKVESVSY